MIWICDKLPEENRIILAYDMLEGLNLGYFSATDYRFYDLSSNKLDNVCAWFYVPEKPQNQSNLINKVRNRNIINRKM